MLKMFACNMAFPWTWLFLPVMLLLTMQQVVCVLWTPVIDERSAVHSASSIKRGVIEGSTSAVHQQHKQGHIRVARSAAVGWQIKQAFLHISKMRSSMQHDVDGHVFNDDDHAILKTHSSRQQQRDGNFVNNPLGSSAEVAGTARSLASFIIKAFRGTTQQRDEALQACQRSSRHGIQPCLSKMPVVCSNQHSDSMCSSGSISTGRSTAGRQLRQIGSTLNSTTPLSVVPRAAPPFSCQHNRSQLVKVTVRLNTTNLTLSQDSRLLSRVQQAIAQQLKLTGLQGDNSSGTSTSPSSASLITRVLCMYGSDDPSTQEQAGNGQNITALSVYLWLSKDLCLASLDIWIRQVMARPAALFANVDLELAAAAVNITKPQRANPEWYAKLNDWRRMHSYVSEWNVSDIDGNSSSTSTGNDTGVKHLLWDNTAGFLARPFTREDAGVLVMVGVTLVVLMLVVLSVAFVQRWVWARSQRQAAEAAAAAIAAATAAAVLDAQTYSQRVGRVQPGNADESSDYGNSSSGSVDEHSSSHVVRGLHSLQLF